MPFFQQKTNTKSKIKTAKFFLRYKNLFTLKNLKNKSPNINRQIKVNWKKTSFKKFLTELKTQIYELKPSKKF